MRTQKREYVMRGLRLLGALATLFLVTSCAFENPGGAHAFEPETTWGNPSMLGEAWIAFGPMEPYEIEHEEGITEEGTVGEFTGSDGCSSINGKYHYMSAVAFVEGPMTSTEMECEDVDTWLSAFVTAEIEGGELVVYGPDGEEIGRLPRNG